MNHPWYVGPDLVEVDMEKSPLPPTLETPEEQEKKNKSNTFETLVFIMVNRSFLEKHGVFVSKYGITKGRFAIHPNSIALSSYNGYSHQVPFLSDLYSHYGHV